MTFQFESLSDFITMSGHGFYVWFCYVVTFVAIAWLIASPIRAQRRFFQEQARLSRIKKAQSSPSRREAHA